MADSRTTLAQLKKQIAKFIQQRDWEQFHSPKNLSMAIAIEAAELMEHFQWHYKGQDLMRLKERKGEIENELADILAFILSFSNLYKIDLSNALLRKLKLNAKKYPSKLVRGQAKKYTEYETGRVPRG